MFYVFAFRLLNVDLIYVLECYGTFISFSNLASAFVSLPLLHQTATLFFYKCLFIFNLFLFFFSLNYLWAGLHLIIYLLQPRSLLCKLVATISWNNFKKLMVLNEQILHLIAISMRILGPRAMFYLAAAVSDFYVPWESMVMIYFVCDIISLCTSVLQDACYFR